MDISEYDPPKKITLFICCPECGHIERQAKDATKIDPKDYIFTKSSNKNHFILIELDDGDLVCCKKPICPECKKLMEVVVEEIFNIPDTKKMFLLKICREMKNRRIRSEKK